MKAPYMDCDQMQPHACTCYKRLAAKKLKQI